MPVHSVSEMKNVIRAIRVKKWIEALAYGSLALDYLITIATLIAVRHYWDEISIFLFYLDEALTAEVILVTILLIMLFSLHHYDSIIDRFAVIRRGARSKRMEAWQKR